MDRVLAKGPKGFAAGEPKPVLFRDLSAGYEGEESGQAGPNPVW